MFGGCNSALKEDEFSSLQQVKAQKKKKLLFSEKLPSKHWCKHTKVDKSNKNALKCQTSQQHQTTLILTLSQHLCSIRALTTAENRKWQPLGQTFSCFWCSCTQRERSLPVVPCLSCPTVPAVPRRVRVQTHASVCLAAWRGVVSCGPVLPSCEDEWSSVTWAALQRPALCVRKVPVINGGGRMKNELIYGQVLREG